MPKKTTHTNHPLTPPPHPQPAIISLLILILLVTSLPTHLDAQPLTLNMIDPLLMSADNHIKNHKWLDAEKNLKNAQSIHQKNRPAAPPDPRITQRLDWCFANISLEKRYEDQSLARFTQHTDSQHALNQLTQVVRLIDRKFHLPPEKNKLVKKALAQLIAATENPVVQNHYNLNIDKLPSLKQSIQSIRRGPALSQPIQTGHVIDIAKTLKRLTEDAGFPPAFAAVELAYAYTKSLDKYSYILTPKHYSSYSRRLSGQYTGIGIDLVTSDSYPLIFDVVPDSPAWLAGILPGDFITHADGYHLINMPLYKISTYLKPANQTHVNLTIQRNHRSENHSLAHQLIHAPSVRNAHLLPRHPHLGYLRIASFDPDTHRELKTAIEKLLQQDARALIFDLRANGGGILQAAISSAELFLNHETIVTVQSEQKTTTYHADSHPPTFDLPIALLVDQHTASAAELFTAALKNNQRAAVFGYNTFGKNLVQTIYHLNDYRTAICLTTASFIPPNKINSHRFKITPDFKPDKMNDPRFAQSSLEFLSGENPVLNLAIQWCNQ